jgi:hypothetical protein
MRTIRASEIGTFLFCRRSWWYQRQGIESQNQAELSGGSQYHRQHGRQVIQSGLLRLAGWLLLLIAILLLVVALTLQWLG